MRDWKSVSPSQFNTFSDCKRQWWFQSVFGLQTPQRPSAALGEAVHDQLEAYVDTGKLPDDSPAGRIAKAGLSLLPEPGTSWTEVSMSERQKEGRDKETLTGVPGIHLAGIKVNGFIDLLDLSGVRPLVIDHKTTSDLKYAKTAAELREDPQMVLYGTFALLAALSQGIEVDEVDAGHVVYLTKGAPLAKKTVVTLGTAHLAAERKKLEGVVEEMKGYAKTRTPDAVPGEPNSCNKYGGCHFRDKCSALGLLSSSSTTFADRFRAETTTPENNMSNIDPMAALKALKARKAAEAAASPPPAQSVAAPAPATTVATTVAATVAATVATTPDAARAALLAKYGIKGKETPYTAPPEEAVSLIVPPDAPPQGKLAAFKAEPAPVAEIPVAETAPANVPDTEAKTVRKPKNYAEKLAALNWVEAQVSRMGAEAMRAAIDGALDGRKYSVLPNGSIFVPGEGNLDTKSIPEEEEEEETEPPVFAPLPEIKFERVPESAPAPILTLYIDCFPEKGRDRDYMMLEEIIRPLAEEAVSVHNRSAKDAERVDYYGLIPYNRGPTYIASLLMRAPPVGVVVCTSRYPATNACLEVLIPLADVVVRAMR